MCVFESNILVAHKVFTYSTYHNRTAVSFLSYITCIIRYYYMHSCHVCRGSSSRREFPALFVSKQILGTQQLTPRVLDFFRSTSTSFLTSYCFTSSHTCITDTSAASPQSAKNGARLPTTASSGSGCPYVQTTRVQGCVHILGYSANSCFNVPL